jgi:hypothetical protein
MRRHFLTRTAVLGSLLALAACDDADNTIEANDTSQRVTTVSAEYSAVSAVDADFGNGKASIFGAPREARILFW